MLQLTIFGSTEVDPITLISDCKKNDYMESGRPFKLAWQSKGLCFEYRLDAHSNAIRFGRCEWCSSSFAQTFTGMNVTYAEQTTQLHYSRQSRYCTGCLPHASRSSAKMRRRAYAWLKTLKCSDCRLHYIAEAMEFDHDPQFVKVDDLSDMVNSASLGRFIDEVQKCDVVCAPCHRSRERDRRLAGAEEEEVQH